jgi:hypothetical protein
MCRVVHGPVSNRRDSDVCQHLSVLNFFSPNSHRNIYSEQQLPHLLLQIIHECILSPDIMPEDQPWTTSRCNRLLRPISSRITILRKQLDKPRRLACEKANGSSCAAIQSSPRQAKFTQPTAGRKRGFEKAHDPDWVPGAKPLAASKKTYGGRGSGKPASIQDDNAKKGVESRPGEISFTPFISRSGSRSFESPQVHSSPVQQKSRGPLFTKMEQMKNSKKLMPDEFAKVTTGLLDAYAKLLLATSTDEARSRKGVRSLRATCLHKIPAYIELEEYFAELDAEEKDEEDRNILDEIYTHLEQTFGARAGEGWFHLKDVVRAHGTALICDAIADELISWAAVHAAVDVCLKASAWDEAEKIIWTHTSNLPSRLKPVRPPNHLQVEQGMNTETPPYLQLIHHFVFLTGRHGLLYDLLEYLISQELLPLEWLATAGMRPIWSRLVRVLSEGDVRTSAHAFRFLETAICASIGLPDDGVFNSDDIDIVLKQVKPSSRKDLRNALDTTFSSLLTVLSSIGLVSQTRMDDTDESTVQRVTWTLDSITVGLLRRKDIRTDLELLDTTRENLEMFAQRALCMMASTFLVHLGGCSSAVDMIRLSPSLLARSFSWISHQYSCHDVDVPFLLATLPSFIASTARCSGKAWHDDGFDQLQRLVDALFHLPGIRLPHKLWNLKRVALESCVEFAQTTNDRDHFAYAREIESSMSQKGRVVLMISPLKDDTPSAAGGFRWEEGIGEWVACTPFAKQEVRRLPRKPMRQLTLLPSPDASDMSQSAGDEQEHQAASDSEEDQQFLQSSPVKKMPRISTSSLGKRRRATSPMVVIPAKRSKFTSPNIHSLSLDTSYISFISTNSEESASEDGPRRSQRTRENVKPTRNGLRPQRSRKSLDTSLRKIAPKTYSEVVESSESDTAAGEEEDPDDRDELGKTPAGVRKQWKSTAHATKRIKRVRGRSCKQPLLARVKDEESDDELSFH